MPTWVAPDGKDGGIDVLAGAGVLGMDNPKLCVQVKLMQKPADVKTARELTAVANDVKADSIRLRTPPTGKRGRLRLEGDRLYNRADFATTAKSMIRSGRPPPVSGGASSSRRCTRGAHRPHARADEGVAPPGSGDMTLHRELIAFLASRHAAGWTCCSPPSPIRHLSVQSMAS